MCIRCFHPYLLRFAGLVMMCLSLKAQISTGFHSFFNPGVNTISPGQSLFANQTITSEGGIFELGFFAPGTSKNYYMGIWYKNLSYQTIVWVANREQSASNPISSSLKLLEDGELVLLNQFNSTIWSSNSTANSPNSTIAILLDNGNFVIREKSNPYDIIWQSFDHPTDTWLPGGKLGYYKLKNEKLALTSWKCSINPAPGLFSFEIDPNGAESLLLLWNMSKIYWSANWPGTMFSQIPEMQLNYHVTNITYVSNEIERTFTFAAAPPSALTRFVVGVSGQFNQYVWSKTYGDEWFLLRIRPPEKCRVYGVCGAYSICNENAARLCDCPKGYEPKTPENWMLEDHSDGCVRKTALECTSDGKDSFLVMHHMSFPANSETFAAANIEECKAACFNICSCTAYAYDNQCLIWKGDLYNLQQLLPNEKKKDFYLRVAPSDSESGETWIVIVVVPGFLCLLGIGLLVFMAKRRRQVSPNVFDMDGPLMFFKYRDLRRATKNFSEKVGEGGFGTVYKGTLQNSSEIAVKKLKSYSKQGENPEKQFRAEVGTIGMIQHVNLIRLLGFCIEDSRRFLIYDYMPNDSLASTLFRKNRKVLDWKTRYRITIGIAKGIAYLHEECRDCIIHCDIKPENILLDAEFNPKVSDFGLAKLIGRDFSRVLTTTRGTRGYLAPEWISGEPITSKADVYSYGMLLFEIISGRRNRDILDDDYGDYFPMRVVRTISNKGEDVRPLLDERLEGIVVTEELERACRAACWCIQDYEKHRPTMGQIVQILEGVSEVSVPPMPRFLQCLINGSVQRNTGSASQSIVQELTIQTWKDEIRNLESF